jgi:hypothetical protein
VQSDNPLHKWATADRSNSPAAHFKRIGTASDQRERELTINLCELLDQPTGQLSTLACTLGWSRIVSKLIIISRNDWLSLLTSLHGLL